MGRDMKIIYNEDKKIRLKEEHDFSWLKKYGKVFKVFDEQDSGNICFGVEKDGIKRFIKYAGAKTIEYSGDPLDAVRRLINATTNYKDLKHPHLIQFTESYEISSGYATVFDWFNGECLHSHWLFTPEEKYTNPKSPNYRFNNLSIEKRLSVFEKVLNFHKHVEEKGYVAIDFYDGSILYDFISDEMKICDIDFYAKRPYINSTGRMWGSNRFMSPEEFEIGAVIDERTNVFNMGAIAFNMFGGTLDRSFEKWIVGKPLYQIALKAVSKKREERYNSVTELYNEWISINE